MDPITLILTALSAGAADSIKDTTNQAVKDAYFGLKTLIKNKFAGKSDAEMTLEKYEQKPDLWKDPLGESLKESGCIEDQDIIDAAQRFMKLIQPQQAGMGKYNVQITGNVHGYAQGDGQQVTMHFGNE